ncbi:MAG: toprim domain-containing protein, partial [Nitrospirae bacterium]|nr:toprim domain-containing protein [Nitrospirota bacterium]
LLSYLKRKGYKGEAIKRSGLITQGARDHHDTFRNRLMFPIFDLRGEVIAFGGRVMDNSMPKYLNSPESPIFYKSRVLYGLNLAKDAIKKAGYSIFAEGYLDVISMHMHGFTNAVAPLGTALSAEHGKLISRFAQDSVLVFDGDAAGLRAAKNGLAILSEIGINTRVLPLPETEDPDSYLRKHGKEAFAGLLDKALSIVDFFAMQKGDKHMIAREALETISKIPNSILQGNYVKMLSDRIKVDEYFVREEFY